MTELPSRRYASLERIDIAEKACARRARNGLNEAKRHSAKRYGVYCQLKSYTPTPARMPLNKAPPMPPRSSGMV